MKSTDYAHTMHSVNASFKALERLNRPRKYSIYPSYITNNILVVAVLKWIKDQENHFSDQAE